MFVLLSACMNQVDKDAPECLNSKISELKANRCGNSYIAEYQFQGNTVYVLNDGLCYPDAAESVLDSSCAVLGIIGGIANLQEINGEIFYDKAQFVKYVWQQ